MTLRCPHEGEGITGLLKFYFLNRLTLQSMCIICNVSASSAGDDGYPDSTECPKIYRKSVLHMLMYTANIYLSRCSTNCGKFLDSQ